jgi:hypothetical protein
MDMNNNNNISALGYAFPFLNPGGCNAFMTTNLQISLNIQLLNISIDCSQINTVLVACNEVILYNQIIAFGYVNIEALDYNMYIGDRNDICPCNENGFTIFSTTINNTSLNAKIYMGVVTYEFLSLLANITGPSHIKYTIWKGTVCPAQVNKINVLKLKKHKTLIMKLTRDVLFTCEGCPIPLSDGCNEQLVADPNNPTLGEIIYAKNLLMNYLQEFPWNMFNLNTYNAFYNQYLPYAN